jgi:hypothetical protein
MARDAQEKTIDGVTYTIRPLPGMRASTFLPRLNKSLGPAFAALAAVKSLKEIDADALKGALVELGERLDEKEMEYLIRTLLGDTTFQPLDSSQPGGILMKQFDDHFRGRPEVVLQLLAHALKANYDGLFHAAASVPGVPLGRVAASTSQKP